MKQARFFDGKVARPYQADLQFTALGLGISYDGNKPVIWPYSSLIADDYGPRPGQPVLITSTLDNQARLYIHDHALWQRLQENAPNLRRKSIFKASWFMITFLFLGALAFIAALFFGWPRLSQAMAPFVPLWVEEQIGDINQAAIRNEYKICEDENAQKVLKDIVYSVTPEQTPHYDSLTITILDSPEANAFVMPMGHIYVFSGFLNRATSMDEIAGVLTHEVGHVYHYHINKQLIQDFGFQIAVSAMTGGGAENLASLAGFYSSLHYSRRDEREADQFAIQQLKKTRYSPRGLADFFERAAKGDELLGTSDERWGWLSYLSTHPDPRQRARYFIEQSDKPLAVTASKEFDILKNACQSAPAHATKDTP